MAFGEGALSDVLARSLSSIGGVAVESSDFERERLPEHLRMLMIVRDDEGLEVARGRSLETLRETLAPRVEKAFHDRVDGALGGLTDPKATELPEVPLPEHIVVEGAAGGVRAWLAFCRRDGRVGVTGHARRDVAMVTHRAFLLEELRRLGGRALSGHLDWLLDGQPAWPEFHLLETDRPLRTIVEDLALDAAFFVSNEQRPVSPPWDIRSRGGVQSCFEAGFSELSRCAENVVERLEDALRLHGSLAFALDAPFPQAWASEIEAMRRELGGFLPRCVRSGSWFELERVPRHLRAIDFRVKRLHEKGAAAERRDLEALREWVLRLEQARPLLAGTVRFAAYEYALQEHRAHLAVPSLALPGSGSRRVLIARWNELCAVSTGRLVPST
jgi:ATP-dependent helicase HrpA